MENRQKAPTSVGPISSFAHLAGALAAKADNDKDEKDDEEDRKKDEKDAKKAEEEEAARVKAEEKEKEEKDKEAARKKAAKEKDTSDDDGDYDDKKARHAERERIHAIMTCIGAKHAVEEAEYIAFCTDAPAAEAIGHLNVKAIELLSEKALKPAPKKDPLRERMASVDLPDIGPDSPSNSSDNTYQDHVRSTAAAIIAAGKKRRGEKV